MKRAAETPTSPVERPARFDRVLRALCALASGPVFLLSTPLRFNLVNAVAATVLSASLLLAWSLPALLRNRLGGIGALLATTLVLGVLGASIGALERCPSEEASCTSVSPAAVGAWTLVWMLMPSALLLLRVTGRWLRALLALPLGLTRRLVRRTTRQRRHR